MTNALWTPARIGRLTLPHRLAMAPMTRSRANPDGTPGPSAALYYGQRASMGLLIAEGTQPSEDGQGYMNTPGLHTQAQAEGWRKVAKAVHDGGGRLYIQIMHVGRISHPDNTPHHRAPVGPSAVSAEQPIFTPGGLQKTPTPRALNRAGIAETIADFAAAARLAVEAGADGVEIHGANGYLVHQFLAPNANRRDDAYGGSIENRARFALETAAAVAQAIGADRTGVRLSPFNPYNGIDEGPEAGALYRHLAARLGDLKLAYLHLIHPGDEALAADMKAAFGGPLIVNRPGAAREALARDIESGLAEVVSVGQMALANPDLVARLKTGAALNAPNRAAYFGGSDAGYVDYPALRA